MSKSARLETIKNVLLQCNSPSYTLKSIKQAIYQNPKVLNYSQITSIPLSTRRALIEAFQGCDQVLTLSVDQLQKSAQCVKALFQMQNDRKVESVFMRFRDSGHTSLCISSQVGCALKCSFCATGAIGFKSQLTVDEITDQVLHFMKHEFLSDVSLVDSQLFKATQRVQTVSFMGQGEALQNPRVFDALSIMTATDGMAISPRRLNVSTVGIIPGIVRLTNEYPSVNLAFSLHNPFGGKERAALVPAERMYPLDEIVKVLERHAQLTNRRIMIAYLLLPGCNDSRDHALKILQLFYDDMPAGLRHLFHLNLLRYNPAMGIEKDKWKRTEGQDIKRFSSYFGSKMSVTVRQSFGLDVDAACGQLYQTHLTANMQNVTALQVD